MGELPKPDWLRKKISLSKMKEVAKLMEDLKIHTVCKEAMCPNISECFAKKQATFLILGNECTRKCAFCGVSKGSPLPPDLEEPKRVAKAVQTLGLRHVVITSPTRDDLKDYGANHYFRVVKAIKEQDNAITVELLIPDMKADREALKTVAYSGAEIIGHNVETVPRLYWVRKGADYERSLNVLQILKNLNPDLITKSGIMTGLGEREEEVEAVFKDLEKSGCSFLSIGQYLAPSKHHAQVAEYTTPERFEEYRKMALKAGLKEVKSSPYTRSSYMAEEYIK